MYKFLIHRNLLHIIMYMILVVMYLICILSNVCKFIYLNHNHPSNIAEKSRQFIIFYFWPCFSKWTILSDTLIIVSTNEHGRDIYALSYVLHFTVQNSKIQWKEWKMMNYSFIVPTLCNLARLLSITIEPIITGTSVLSIQTATVHFVNDKVLRYGF